MELELWKIGSSLPAPKFNLVSKPNDWQKQLTQQTAAASGLYELYREFWTSFIEFCGPTSLLRNQNGPSSTYWMRVKTIKPGVGINLTVSKKTREMGCQIWIDSRDAGHVYDTLLASKAQLHSILGANLAFEARDSGKAFVIYESSTCDVLTKSEWPSMQAWMKSRAEAFVATFPPMVNAIN